MVADHYEQCVECGDIDLISTMVAVAPNLCRPVCVDADMPHYPQEKRYITRRTGNMEWNQHVSWAHSVCATEKGMADLEEEWAQVQIQISHSKTEAAKVMA